MSASGLTDETKVSGTFNGISTRHSVLNTTTQAADGSSANLVILGPALNSIPDNLNYSASSVGVMTSCYPISQLCQLLTSNGANTRFNCSSGFFGNLAVPEVNSTAVSWTAESPHFIYGAEFFDDNLTQPYNNYSVADYH